MKCKCDVTAIERHWQLPVILVRELTGGEKFFSCKSTHGEADQNRSLDHCDLIQFSALMRVRDEQLLRVRHSTCIPHRVSRLQLAVVASNGAVNMTLASEPLRQRVFRSAFGSSAQTCALLFLQRRQGC